MKIKKAKIDDVKVLVGNQVQVSLKSTSQADNTFKLQKTDGAVTSKIEYALKGSDDIAVGDVAYTKYDNNYQYDGSASARNTNYIGSSPESDGAVANVYEVKGNSGGKEVLKAVAVNVKANGKVVEEYDGNPHVAEGYTVVSESSNGLYNASAIAYTKEADIKETEAGAYKKVLTKEMLSNTDGNFIAEFIVDPVENANELVIKDTFEIGEFVLELSDNNISAEQMELLKGHLENTKNAIGYFDVTMKLDGEAVHNGFGTIELGFGVGDEYSVSDCVIHHLHFGGNVTSEHVKVAGGKAVTSVKDLSQFAIEKAQVSPTPTEEPTKPTEEPTKPTEEPTKPTGTPTKPTGTPTKPTGMPTLHKATNAGFTGDDGNLPLMLLAIAAAFCLMAVVKRGKIG